MTAGDALSLNNYSVEFAGGFGMKLNFRDESGNIVMRSHGKVFVSEQSLETAEGTLLGTVTHKMISFGPTYELHEGGPKDKIIGSIKIPVQLVSTPGTLTEIDIRDTEEKVIATANGSFLDSEFNVSDTTGKLIAKVTKKPMVAINSAFLQSLANLGSRNYTMSIIEPGAVSALVLMEFLIVIEMFLLSGRSNPGMIKGGSSLGGLGPGVGGFKL